MGGTGVTSHAYTSPAIRRAVDNGVRGIEHGNLLDRETAKLLGESCSLATPYQCVPTSPDRKPHSLSPSRRLDAEAGETVAHFRVVRGAECSVPLGCV